MATARGATGKQLLFVGGGIGEGTIRKTVGDEQAERAREREADIARLMQQDAAPAEQSAQPVKSQRFDTHLEPLYDNIVVEIDHSEEDSAGVVAKGQLFVPTAVVRSEDAQEGIVKEVGAKCDYLLPGDKVIFGAFTGTQVQINGHHYIVMRETNVLSKVHDV